jgi:hypothetical protein
MQDGEAERNRGMADAENDAISQVTLSQFVLPGNCLWCGRNLGEGYWNRLVSVGVRIPLQDPAALEITISHA